MSQQRTFEFMRLTALIHDLQPEGPFSRHMHLGRGEEKVLRDYADGLFRRVTGHHPQGEDSEEPSEGHLLENLAEPTGHVLASLSQLTLQCRFMTTLRDHAIPLAGLYVILDPSVRPDRPLMEVLDAAAAGGVRLFQYRNKTASMKDAFAKVGPLRQRARELGVLFLVNDRCDLALAIDADGVHLGQTDLPYRYARQLLGPHRYIGLSTHNADQVAEAARLRPDYIGFGPIFRPASKADHDPVVGIEGLRSIRTLTSLPVFAIGGIQPSHVRQLLDAGANGIAVIGAICGAPDITTAAATFTGQIV